MKYLLFIIAILLFSCNKEGEVTGRSMKNIKINGKEYYFMQVVPEDGARPVWLLIPRDARVELPQATSHLVRCGKNCHFNLTAIWVKS